MATKVIVKGSNAWNKPRALRRSAVEQFVGTMPTESYPNGNTGKAEAHVHLLFGEGGEFASLVTRREPGDPLTCGRVVIDPQLASAAQLARMVELAQSVRLRRGDNVGRVLPLWQALAHANRYGGVEIIPA